MSPPHASWIPKVQARLVDARTSWKGKAEVPSKIERVGTKMVLFDFMVSSVDWEARGQCSMLVNPAL